MSKLLDKLEEMSTVDMFLKDPNIMFDIMFASDKFQRCKDKDLAMFRSELGIFLYLMEGNKPIGLCHARATKNKDRLKIIKLEWVVLPEHRGKGIAKKLANDTINLMGQWGVDTKAPFDMIQADMEPSNNYSIQVAKDIGLEFSYSYTHDKTVYMVYGDIICYE